MRRHSIILIAAIVSLDGSMLRAQQPGTASVPVVTLRYSDLLDAPCYGLMHEPPDAATIQLVKDSLPAIAARWRADAPVLFAAAQRLTGVPFQFHEVEAAAITCPALGSMSLPLIIDVGVIAHGANPEDRPLAERVSRTLFHEVLHRYVSDRLEALGRNTPALRKYANEPAVVRSHLYNVAIMEEVYRALGRTTDLAATRNRISNRAAPGGREAGDMGRALEIIDKEGAANLVRELAVPAGRP